MTSDSIPSTLRELSRHRCGNCLSCDGPVTLTPHQDGGPSLDPSPSANSINPWYLYPVAATDDSQTRPSLIPPSYRWASLHNCDITKRTDAPVSRLETSRRAPSTATAVRGDLGGAAWWDDRFPYPPWRWCWRLEVGLNEDNLMILSFKGDKRGKSSTAWHATGFQPMEFWCTSEPTCAHISIRNIINADATGTTWRSLIMNSACDQLQTRNSLLLFIATKSALAVKWWK